MTFDSHTLAQGYYFWFLHTLMYLDCLTLFPMKKNFPSNLSIKESKGAAYHIHFVVTLLPWNIQVTQCQ
jgi:hypothetical protein